MVIKRKSQEIFIIDATFLFRTSYEAFHSTPLLKDEKGNDTTGLYSVIRDILRLRRRLAIHDALIVLGKDSAPPKACSLATATVECLQRLGIPFLYEFNKSSGELFAALAPYARWIVTDNKAMLQFINSHNGLILPMHGLEFDIVTLKSMQEKVGVSPSQIPSLLTLTEKREGSSILTQKQAIRFLEIHNTVQAGLENIAKQDRISRKLLDSKEALLERCCELQFRAISLEQISHAFANTKMIDNEEKASAALEYYGFWSLKRLLSLSSKSEISIAVPSLEQSSLDYKSVRTRADLAELENMINAAEICAIDTEGSDKDPRSASLYGVSFSVKPGQAVYVPLTQADLKGVSFDEVRSCLKSILNKKTRFIGHNVKFDYVFLWKHGIQISDIHFDTLLAAYDCFGDWDFFNLGDLVRKILGKKIRRYSDLVKKDQTFLDRPFTELMEHACTDADMALRLYYRLNNELHSKQIDKDFFSERMPLLRALAEKETVGVKIDLKKISAYADGFERETDSLKAEIFRQIGFEFELDSPKETCDALAKVVSLGEKVNLRAMTQSVMEQLAWRHPLLILVIKYRRTRKRLRDLAAIGGATKIGRMFPIFNLIRQPHSHPSSNPNLDEALRIGAIKDSLLQDTWIDSARALSRIQQLTGDRTLDKKLRDEPDKADMLLAIVLGLSDYAICKQFLISPKEIAKIRSMFETRHRQLFAWVEQFCKNAMMQGYAEFEGHRRYMEGLRSSNIEKKSRAIISVMMWLLRYGYH